MITILSSKETDKLRKLCKDRNVFSLEEKDFKKSSYPLSGVNKQTDLIVVNECLSTDIINEINGIDKLCINSKHKELFYIDKPDFIFIMKKIYK